MNAKIDAPGAQHPEWMSGTAVMRWQPPIAVDRPFVVLLPAQTGEQLGHSAGSREPPAFKPVVHFQSLDALMEFVVGLLPEGQEP